MTRRTGSLSIPGAATLSRLAREAVLSPVVPIRHRSRLLRRLGATHVADAAIGSQVRIKNPDALHLADGAFVNEGVFFDAGEVHLGERVFVGPRAMFVTGWHEMGGPAQRAADGYHRPITVGRGSWIGAGAIILPGITIGEGCVIGAGAVVTKDCEPNGVYAGVPAKRIKELDA